MRILLFSVICFFATALMAQPKLERTNSAPGEFSRYGFTPRGIAMGNSISALKSGNISSYYNPALVVFQKDNYINASAGVLSLDRALNFLGFTRRFDFYAKGDTSENRTPRSTAGVSAGIINSGVAKIDGRDNQGLKTGDVSTSENQFFVAFANKFSNKFSIGVGLKFYYYKLYEKVTANGVGFDFGFVYSYSDNLSFSVVVQDINSSYKWDTSTLYGTSGSATTNQFPVSKKIGTAYVWRENQITIVGEYEFNNMDRKLLRIGVEYPVLPELIVRAGVDKWHLKNSDESAVPSFGFSYNYEISGYNAGFDYALTPEQFSGSLRHFLGISFIF